MEKIHHSIVAISAETAGSEIGITDDVARSMHSNIRWNLRHLRKISEFSGIYMSQNKGDTLKQYFIAFIPPAPVHDEALALKHYFQQKYNSKAALNSPPHITLHMPFRWKESKENDLTEKLQRFVRNFDPIKICLDNFSSFPPRVIFINVVNNVVLNDFQKNIQRFCKKELNLFNANYREDPFHPHLTLAFRDLKKSAYKEAWEEFKSREFKAEFMADKLALLKHDGKRWNVHRDFNLESSYSTDNTSALATTEG